MEVHKEVNKLANVIIGNIVRRAYIVYNIEGVNSLTDAIAGDIIFFEREVTLKGEKTNIVNQYIYTSDKWMLICDTDEMDEEVKEVVYNQAIKEIKPC